VSGPEAKECATCGRRFSKRPTEGSLYWLRKKFCSRTCAARSRANASPGQRPDGKKGWRCAFSPGQYLRGLDATPCSGRRHATRPECCGLHGDRLLAIIAEEADAARLRCERVRLDRYGSRGMVRAAL
jgi:hypothetical protein